MSEKIPGENQDLKPEVFMEVAPKFKLSMGRRVPKLKN